jgi:tRNA threonylcarbamoyladenosine biosynthesis protein TsaB
MRILALETTEKIGTVAAMAECNLLSELQLDPSQRSAQSLAPGIQTLLKSVGWSPDDVQLMAVAIGPGSFTGLRVGVTTAKMFAYAVGADILGINTLETIAAVAPDDVAEISVVIDAQRGQLAERRLVRGLDGGLAPVGIERLVDAGDWLKELERLPAGFAVSGPVLHKLAERLPAHIRRLDQDCWSPRAAMVARLAARDYANGRRDDLWTLVPHYCRRSAAEEKAGVV